MILPFPPRRSHLTAFWLGLHLAAVAGAAGLGLALGTPVPVLVAGVILATTLVLGLVLRDVPLSGYRAWNRVARVIARLGQGWVLAITYYLVLGVTARSGSRLDLAPASGSMWKPYRAGGHAAANGNGEPAAGWARRLAMEARGSERAWWVGVLPLLLVLSLFASDTRDEAIPSNIYTLY